MISVTVNQLVCQLFLFSFFGLRRWWWGEECCNDVMLDGAQDAA